MQLSSHTSAALAGIATVLPAGEEVEFFRKKHAESNKVEANKYTSSSEAAVVKITIKSIRMTVGGVEGHLERWHSRQH